MLKPGDEIDIWVVDRALGQGGMGSVYRCHNREAKRILAAVKVLDASLGRQSLAKARFVREAEILFALDHPGIVKVRNVRMDLATPYLEMEFVDGVNLEQRIQEGPMPVAEALPIFRQVADALAYLHGRGIRHRDIKPSNIVIQPSGSTKLVDFGIATEADGATITQQGQTFGSVSYAPPEWLEPTELDPVLWDVYATGVVFWEVLTGVQAFPMSGAGTMQQQVVRMMTVKQRHPPLDPGSNVPRALRALVRDMTHPYWKDRIQDAETIRKRLAEVDPTDLDPTEAVPPSAMPTWFPAAASDPGRPPAGATMVPDFDPTEEAPAPRAAPPNLAPLVREKPAPPPAPRPPTRPPEAAPLPSPPVRGPNARLAAGRLVVAALVGIGIIWWRVAAPPETRDVVVTVAGLPADVPFALRLGTLAPTSTVDGRATFVGVPPGDLVLRAAVGEGCSASSADPAWCTATEVPLTLVPDEEPLQHTLSLAPPTPRALRLAFSGLAADAAPSARLGDGPAVPGDASGVTLAVVPPGEHVVSVSLGACPDTATGCATAGSADACPPGCSSWKGTVVVPAGLGTHEASVALPTPAAAAAAAPVQAAAASAAEARPRGGSVVTASAFARWIGKRPEWAPDAARAAGKADGSYLSGWEGASPPAGKEGHAVVNVSWAAANAYCAGRGGLVGVDEPPLTWTDSATQPWHEYRSDGGKPAWRRSDGATSRAVNPGESGAFIGFRCAR